MIRRPVGIQESPALVGESSAIAALNTEIAMAARTDAKVLILGETGVGKEIVARRIHCLGARRSRPFIALNCSGVPDSLLESELFGHVRGSFTGAFRDKPGLIEQADGGTLFLDELGEMTLRMQGALLRFTETGEIQRVGADGRTGTSDVRLVTATNRDLPDAIREGNFREDLFYRLNVIQIRVAPLRERGDDILLLMQHYLRWASTTHAVPCPALAKDAEEVLRAYHWPGNVRELKNIAERLALYGGGNVLTARNLPAEVFAAAAARKPLTLVAGVADGSVADPRHAEDNAAVSQATASAVDELMRRMATGETFWDVVYRGFKAREITRTLLMALIDRGLQTTNGSYRALLKVFNLADGDYKRFHAFLYQQRCNLPVAPYRKLRARFPVVDVYRRAQIA